MATTDKPVPEMSADELWWMLVRPDLFDDEEDGTDGTEHDESAFPDYYCVLHGTVTDAHSTCTANLCPYCASPVTNAQINDGDAFPIDERGPDDGKYAHRECAQESKSR